YCLAGGIRASIWTDAAQTVVMFLAMILMLFVGVSEIGGLTVALEKLSELPPGYLALFPEKVGTGVLAIGLFILGYVMGGVGIVAQPHIMIRFMALDDAKHMARARTYYYSFYLMFCLITFSVGLAARLIFPDTAAFDKELALPMMTTRLLPDFLIGLVLAGIFAASMSTADSQILSCSAAVTNDIAPERMSSVFATKMATVFVTLVALGISLMGSDSVFTLVLDAWSMLAAAFAPLIIVYALGEKLTEFKALAIMIGSVAVAITWNKMGLGAIIYDAAPSIAFGVILHFAILKHLPSKTAEN
ncbi:MAG: sodium/proline symporter, partial [Planctomycetota bacterium]|nr:sodium/proline symporter [Planctomycetota bacterium]